MSRNSESRQIIRGRGRNPFPARDRSTPGPLLPAGRITRTLGEVARRAETNASSSPSGSRLFSSASNVGIHGGSMISAGGNVTIINTREDESTSREPYNNEMAEREALREVETTSTPVQRPQAISQRSCEIYYRNLVVKGRGSPLWIPEPSYNLPVQCQRKGISIGDVGVLSAEGSFTFFFNICLPHDHPINQMGVPEGFIPLSPPITPHNIRVLQEFSADSYVASESIEISRRHYSDSLTTDLIFESSAEEGAVLTVPHGARSEYLVNTLRFRGYMAKHIENWYRYIIGVCGCEAKNGDVRLVIGCDKTDVWGMAAFVKSTEAVRLRFQPISMGQSYKWEYSGSFDTRTGPDPEVMERLRQSDDDNRTRQDTSYNNQCLFARTLNANLRDNIWKDIVHKIYSDMGVDPEEASRESQYSSAIMRTGLLNPTTGKNSFDGRVPDGKSAADRLGFSEESLTLNISNVSTAMMAHPSTSINELLWQNFHHKCPTAKMIITDDDDWISVLQTDDPTLPEPEELYKRIMAREPEISADLENDFISLRFVPNDLMSQDHIPPGYPYTLPAPAVPYTPHVALRQTSERMKAEAPEKERQRDLQQAEGKRKVEEQMLVISGEIEAREDGLRTEEEGKRAEERHEALAGGAGGAEVGSSKRPMRRFSIGSNSYKGSGIDSKSGGSGSDVFGGNRDDGRGGRGEHLRAGLSRKAKGKERQREMNQPDMAPQLHHQPQQHQHQQPQPQPPIFNRQQQFQRQPQQLQPPATLLLGGTIGPGGIIKTQWLTGPEGATGGGARQHQLLQAVRPHLLALRLPPSVGLVGVTAAANAHVGQDTAPLDRSQSVTGPNSEPAQTASRAVVISDLDVNQHVNSGSNDIDSDYRQHAGPPIREHSPSPSHPRSRQSSLERNRTIEGEELKHKSNHHSISSTASSNHSHISDRSSGSERAESTTTNTTLFEALAGVGAGTAGSSELPVRIGSNSDQGRGMDSKSGLMAKQSLPAPSLRQNARRTIVWVTSESEFETDSEDDGSWSSKEITGDENEDRHAREEQLRQQELQRQQQSLYQQKQQIQPQRQQQQNQLLQQQPVRPPGVRRTQSSHYPAPNAHGGGRQVSRVQQRQTQLNTQTIIEQAALEAQRQRDMFVKLPTSSIQNLAKARSRSVGLLTQLMNPNPDIFPVNHPYKHGFGAPMSLMRPLVPAAPASPQPTPAEANQVADANVSRPTHHCRNTSSMVVDRKSAAVPGLSRTNFLPPSRAIGVYRTKSAPALPISSQIMAGTVSTKAPPTIDFTTAMLINMHSNVVNPRGSRPKSPPKDQLLEDSGSEAEADIQVSMSVAQEKLKALAQRSHILPNTDRNTDPFPPPLYAGPSGHADDDTVPQWARVSQPQPQQLAKSQSEGQTRTRHTSNSLQFAQINHNQTLSPTKPNAVPIPLGYPYNLPPPPAPSTPRATRRQMLSTEISESLRRNLLWERQVNLAGFRGSVSGSGRRHSIIGVLQPLTTASSMEQMHAKGTGAPKNSNGDHWEMRRGGGAPGNQEEDEGQKAIARNISWINDYQYFGW